MKTNLLLLPTTIPRPARLHKKGDLVDEGGGSVETSGVAELCCGSSRGS